MASDKPKPKAKQKKQAPVVEIGKPTEEAPAAAPQSVFSIDDRVHHPMFGDGRVESIEDDKLTIEFEGRLTKVIRKDFVTRKR